MAVPELWSTNRRSKQLREETSVEGHPAEWRGGRHVRVCNVDAQTPGWGKVQMRKILARILAFAFTHES